MEDPIRNFLAALICLLFAAPALAVPPGGDDWARDTMSTLAERGLVDVAGQRSFLGSRATSRWEIARDVARLLDSVQQSGGSLVTSEELKQLRSLASAYQLELAQMGFELDTSPRAPSEHLSLGTGFQLASPPTLSMPELALDADLQRLRGEFELEPSLHLETGYLSSGPNTGILLPTTGPGWLDRTHLGMDWQLGSDWRLRSGVDLAFDRGLTAPGLTVSDPRFDEISSAVAAPYLGVDRRLTESTAINMDIRYFSAREDFRSHNLEPAESTARPSLSSDSWEVNTRFVVRF